VTVGIPLINLMLMAIQLVFGLQSPDTWAAIPRDLAHLALVVGADRVGRMLARSRT